MDIKKWENLYRMMMDLTPLEVDCGSLCSKKCCSTRNARPGVCLFPGEEVMFEKEAGWFKIEEHPAGEEHFTGAKPLFLNCRGSCPREKRPLACRLFPLAPYLDRQGRLEIIFDGDALFICPLVRLKGPEDLAPAFVEQVREVWLDLLKDAPVRESAGRYSARVDRQAAEPWRKLFSF